jgi:preflagellin peptidase FlaK
MSNTEVTTIMDVLRVFLGIVLLCFASYTDFKTRRVKNEVWMLMGFVGGVILLIQMFYDSVAWEYYLIFVPVGILFASMFFEHEPLYDSENKKFNFKIFIVYILGIIALHYQFYSSAGETFFYQLLTIPVLIVFFFILYQFGAIHGGADAKALMTLAIFVPFYPHFFGFPVIQFSSDRVAETMELFFPFAFLILMNSVIFVVWAFLAFFVFNAAKKDFGFPEMILGYKMDIEEVEKKFVWPMERIVDEERVLVLFPKKNDPDSLKRLKEEGVKRIWITPKIPFIVFLTAGFIISVFLGNLFVAFIELLG